MGVRSDRPLDIGVSSWDFATGPAGGGAELSAGAAVQLFPHIEPLRAGTADGYGAGGFTATITVNGPGNDDDTIAWQPEAFINTR